MARALAEDGATKIERGERTTVLDVSASTECATFNLANGTIIKNGVGASALTLLALRRSHDRSRLHASTPPRRSARRIPHS